MSKSKSGSDAAKELAALKRAVRRFLRAVMNVPMRAVDCDQDEVFSAWDALDELVRRK